MSTISIRAPAEKVWQALTDKNRMKEWYFDIAGCPLPWAFSLPFSREIARSSVKPGRR